MKWAVLAVVLVVACSSPREDARPPQPTPTPSAKPEPSAPPPIKITVDNGPQTTQPEPFTESSVLAEKPATNAEATTAMTANVEWSDVVQTNDCWFFSGPAGRDTALGPVASFAIDGDYVRLTWGRATFEGILRGKTLAVARKATHSFQGSWTIDETITGAYIDGVLKARYHYAECEEGELCPGRCSIDATLTIVRVR